MMSTPKFKIGFGRVGRTLVCEDEAGTLCFAFDISPAENHAKEKWKLHLDPQPLTQVGDNLEYTSITDRARIALAFEEAKAYAAARGYLVVSP
jgi:hypothetical protein